MNDYYETVKDILVHQKVLQMDKYIQHGNITCLEHCLYVSYVSYKMSKLLGLRFKEVSRAALLHDFFLYDWHGQKPYEGLHGFYHAGIALDNAKKYFPLTKIEEDIIGKHMWPLNIALPKYKESFIVLIADRYCTIMEVFKFTRIHGKLKNFI